MDYHPGDRIALVHTTDACTALRPGDTGTVRHYDEPHGQIHIVWYSGSTLSMLPKEGDKIRLLTKEPSGQGTDTGSRPAASYGDPP